MGRARALYRTLPCGQTCTTENIAFATPLAGGKYKHTRKVYLAESSGLISLFGLVKLPYSSWNSTGIEKVCPTLNGPSISPIVKRSAAASENMEHLATIKSVSLFSTELF